MFVYFKKYSTIVEAPTAKYQLSVYPPQKSLKHSNI